MLFQLKTSIVPSPLISSPRPKSFLTSSVVRGTVPGKRGTRGAKLFIAAFFPTVAVVVSSLALLTSVLLK